MAPQKDRVDAFDIPFISHSHFSTTSIDPSTGTASTSLGVENLKTPVDIISNINFNNEHQRSSKMTIESTSNTTSTTFNTDDDEEENKSSDGFGEERRALLERASRGLPHILQLMSKANGNMGHKFGNEVGDLRSIWCSGSKYMHRRSGC
jgi:hypothetical protein